eukprot:SAG22_NODE_928_length_6464_cov_2.852789_2_plen_101_part_00
MPTTPPTTTRPPLTLAWPSLPFSLPPRWCGGCATKVPGAVSLTKRKPAASGGAPAAKRAKAPVTIPAVTAKPAVAKPAKAAAKVPVQPPKKAATAGAARR